MKILEIRVKKDFSYCVRISVTKIGDLKRTLFTPPEIFRLRFAGSFFKKTVQPETRKLLESYYLDREDTDLISFGVSLKLVRANTVN